VTHSEMKRRQQDEEDDPFTALRCQHAQSECCAQQKDKSECLGDVYIRVLTVFIDSGK
jgi:hypothetical protein